MKRIICITGWTIVAFFLAGGAVVSVVEPLLSAASAGRGSWSAAAFWISMGVSFVSAAITFMNGLSGRLPGTKPASQPVSPDISDLP